MVSLLPIDSKPLVVVIDTNIWRSEFLLKSHLGAALVYLIRARKAQLGMPEVVKREIRKHIVRAGAEAAEKVIDGFKKIEILIGSRPDYKLPTATDLEAAVAQRLGELERFLVVIPFTLDHATAALDMIDLDLPPNGQNNQQFKDSAIWQSLLELSRSHNVMFATSDKGFFKDRNPKNGLAANLIADCKRVAGHVDVYYELTACLESLQKDTPQLDKAAFLKLIKDHLAAHLKERASRHGFALGDVLECSISPFVTEKVGMLAISFELTCRLIDVTQPEALLRDDATARVKGDCSFNTETEALEDMLLDSEEFVWSDQDGKKIRKGNTYMSATFCIGTPNVQYKLRHPIA